MMSIKEELKEFFNKKEEFLISQRVWIFILLSFVGGYLGAFTYFLRGRVFCNAQTGNIVLLALSIAEKNNQMINYTLLSMFAYLSGIVISEFLEERVNRKNLLKWETLLIFLEIVVTIFLGFLPETAPYEISQLSINFITAMQFNTFRQAHGINMSTTFCTNHVKQVGANFVKYMKVKRRRELTLSLSHLMMVLSFLLGGVISAWLGSIYLGKTIWGATLILLIVFITLLSSDIKKGEK